ncbi:hypothetical protein D3C80_1495530 [compost metagenome]
MNPAPDIAVIPTAAANGLAMVRAVAIAPGAKAGPTIGMAAVDAKAARPACNAVAWAFALIIPAALSWVVFPTSICTPW